MKRILMLISSLIVASLLEAQEPAKWKIIQPESTRIEYRIETNVKYQRVFQYYTHVNPGEEFVSNVSISVFDEMDKYNSMELGFTGYRFLGVLQGSLVMHRSTYRKILHSSLPSETTRVGNLEEYYYDKIQTLRQSNAWVENYIKICISACVGESGRTLDAKEELVYFPIVQSTAVVVVPELRLDGSFILAMGKYGSVDNAKFVR